MHRSVLAFACTLVLLACVQHTTAQVVISEMLVRATEPDFPWVELQNLSNNTVDLSNWVLTDDTIKYRIPVGNTILPLGFWVVAVADLGFQLSISGNSISLLNYTQRRLHSVYYPPSPVDFSIGRYVTGGVEHFELMTEKSMGFENAYPIVSPVVISSIRYSVTDEQAQYFVLENRLDTAVPLFHPLFPSFKWRLTGDSIDTSTRTGFVLGPKRKAVFVAGFALLFSRIPGIPPHAFFSLESPSPLITVALSRSGNLTVYRPDDPLRRRITPATIRVDIVSYTQRVGSGWPTGNPGFVLVRKNLSAYGDDPTNWIAVDDYLNTSLFDPVPNDGWIQPAYDKNFLPIIIPASPIPSLNKAQVLSVANIESPALKRKAQALALIPIILPLVFVFAVLTFIGLTFGFRFMFLKQKPKTTSVGGDD